MLLTKGTPKPDPSHPGALVWHLPVCSGPLEVAGMTTRGPEEHEEMEGHPVKRTSFQVVCWRPLYLLI